MYYKTDYISPVGRLTLVSDGESLVGLWIENQRHFCEHINGEVLMRDDLSVFLQTKQWLDSYFNGENPDPTGISLAPVGGEFRQSVWKILQKIPYGTVTTYGEIAKRLNKEHMSPRAVGGAVGHNPISIIIPCHRVVGADGSLTGYAGGIDAKIKLLQLEGVEVKV